MGYATTNEGYNEHLSITSGCYNENGCYKEREGLLSADLALTCTWGIGLSPLY